MLKNLHTHHNKTLTTLNNLALPFFAFLMVLISSNLTAQNTQLSLSGTIGIVKTDYVEYFLDDQQFKAVGTSLGLELNIGKRLTLGGDVDWQRFESEAAIAEPYPPLSLIPVIYNVERHQFNIRPTLRYYFKEAFRGLYVGVYGTYSYLTITTSGHPANYQYSTDYPADPSDDFGGGGGLTYGYRLKLTSALRVSAFGSHQLFWNDSPKYQQQDHQLGLGLNWAF